MRIALIVVGAIAVLAVIVVGIGTLLPRRHTASRSAIFRSKPERLFALVAGPPSWRPDVRKYEHVAGNPELWRETDNHGQTITYEVVELKAPTLLKRRIATPNLPFDGTWTIALEDQNGLTRVRITEDGNVYNPVFRFVSRFLMGHTKTIDSYLSNLAKATGEQVTIED